MTTYFIALAAFALFTLSLAALQCAVVVVNTYMVGFRAKALELVRQNIADRLSDADGPRFERRDQLTRWERLQERAKQAATEQADATGRDKALAVLAGKPGDEEFLDWVNRRRCRFQAGRIYQLEHLLAGTDGVGAVIDGHSVWLREVEWRLRSRAVRDVGRPVWDTVRERGNVSVARAGLSLVLAPIAIALLVRFVFPAADPLAVYADAAVTLGVVYVARGWWLLLVEALNPILEGTPRGYVRSFYWIVGTLAVLGGLYWVLVALGVLGEFWQHGLAWEDKKLSQLHMSASVAVACGVLLFNGVLVVIGYRPVREALDSQIVLSQRIRSAGAVVALAGLLVPVNIWLWRSVIRGRISYVPSTYRVASLAGFAAGLCLFAVSIALRRRERRPPTEAAGRPPAPETDPAKQQQDMGDGADAASSRHVEAGSPAAESAPPPDEEQS